MSVGRNGTSSVPEIVVPGRCILDLGDAEGGSRIGFGGLVVSASFFLAPVFGYADGVGGPQEGVRALDFIDTQVLGVDFGDYEEAVFLVLSFCVDCFLREGFTGGLGRGLEGGGQ